MKIEARCPHCGAKPRNRALVWLLETHLVPRLGPRAEVLEVGASAIAARHHPRIVAAGGARYTAIDVRRLKFHRTIPAPHRFVEMDISRAAFADASFDLILCNNTLPYVRDYRAALADIRRCLKPQGLAMIDTHREHGSSY